GLVDALGGPASPMVGQRLKSRDEAASLALRLLAILGRPFTVEGRTLAVSASIGIARYPDDGRDFTELLKHADAAMYAAKDAGRGTFRFYEPSLGAQSAERL